MKAKGSEQPPAAPPTIEYVPTYAEFAHALVIVTELNKARRERGQEPYRKAWFSPSLLQIYDMQLTRYFPVGELRWYNEKASSELIETAKHVFPEFQKYSLFRQFFDDTDDPGYTGDDTGDAPPSEPADTSQRAQMWDRDLNTELKIAVKLARTEALARLVDLGNPALAPDERLRRARRLVASYQRRKAENPGFPASPEVRAAFSVVNKENYRRRKAAAAGQSARLAS